MTSSEHLSVRFPNGLRVLTSAEVLPTPGRRVPGAVLWEGTGRDGR